MTTLLKLFVFRFIIIIDEDIHKGEEGLAFYRDKPSSFKYQLFYRHSDIRYHVLQDNFF